MKGNGRFHDQVIQIIRESKDTERRRHLSAALRIVLGLLFLVVVGTAALLLPWMGAERPLTFAEAFFTATSALTVTGLSIIRAGTDLSPLGQAVLLVLIQVGGVGYMFVAALTMRLIGRRLFILDRLALSSSLGLNTPEAILQILKRSFYGIITIELAGSVLLYIHWGRNQIVTERLAFYALFHSISAFCNAGFDLFGNDALFPGGFPIDNVTLIVLGILIFVGGLGIPVLSELFSWSRGQRLSLNTRVTMGVVAILVLFGWVGFYTAEAASHEIVLTDAPTGVLVEAPLRQKIVQTWFQSISARTAGFAGFADFERITSASQILLIALMFIGCAPASMGGGITTGTFSVLFISLGSYVRGFSDVQIAKRTISPATVRRAGAVLTISILLTLTATFLLLLTHDMSVGEASFEVVSAFATCGLSLGATSKLNGFGLFVIALMMFWGRLGALTIVIAVAQGRTGTQPVSYPEEQLLIG